MWLYLLRFGNRSGVEFHSSCCQQHLRFGYCDTRVEFGQLPNLVCQAYDRRVPATAATSPTARRFELARRLRELRAEAGKSVDEAAQELECSPTKISRIETGQRVATALDAKVLGRFYGLSERAQADLMTLVTEARKRGWWHDYRSLDEQTKTFIGLESAAARIFEVEALRLPGLLQTEAYANALVHRLRSPNFWEDEGNPDPDEIVATRLKRQQRVNDGALELLAVVDEAALSRRIGEPQVIVDQIEHLIKMAEYPNITLQVTTFDLGSHPAMDSGFTIMEFNTDMADVVYLEGLAGNSIIRADDQPNVVQKFRDAALYLTNESALSPERTLTWLNQFQQKIRTASPDRRPPR